MVSSSRLVVEVSGMCIADDGDWEKEKDGESVH